MIVVRNGIDCTRFCPDPVARERVRAEWGIQPDEPLVGFDREAGSQEGPP